MGNICKKIISGNRPGPRIRTVVPNITLPEDVNFRHKSHPNREYPSNRVKTTKYTIFTFLPKNLFEQFHRYANIYFIAVALLNWIPGISAFAKEISMVPIFFVLSVTALKDAFEDFRRYQSDKRVNIASCRRYCRKAGRYMKSEWSQLYVGDFVHLSCNEIIPADILLLKSSDSLNLCHIETSNIDGETNLKQRYTATGLSYAAENFSPDKFTNSIECELPSADIYKFHGNIIQNNSLNQNKIPINQSNLLLRGCLIRNTDFVEGIVVYAGPETKAMLNNRGPRYKRSKLERRMNRDLANCVVMLLFLCFFCATGSGIWVGRYNDISVVPFIPQQDFTDFSPTYQGFIVFWTYILIFQAVIPLPLYVSLEVIKAAQVYFIQNDKELYYEPTDRRVECRALNITEDLGQVEYIFSDKTGTLTENQMEFKSCTIGGVDFPHGCDIEDSANDIRRSRYSMSNISRCSMDLINLKLEPSLQRDINSMSLTTLETRDSSVSPQTRRVQDFFLLMALCNTVVVSPHPHEDQMDASGNLADGSETFSDKNLLDRFLNSNGGRHKGMENNGFRDEEDIGRAATPSEGSIASTSILSEGSALGRYDAESPDELALVKAASTYGCRLIKRMLTRVTVALPAEGIVDYDVLHVLPFDSVRKRMSVIVICPFSKEIILYTKGADSAILSQLNRSYKEKEEEKRMLELTEQHLEAYAMKGLRTLCMAKKVINRDDYEEWRGKHVKAENSMDDRDKKVFESSCCIEKDLELLGATGIEDKLQEGVPETIANLRKAGIKVWVLTGDKQETAIQIAYASKLISPDEPLIIINGRDKETTHDQLEYHVKDLGLHVEYEIPQKTSWWKRPPKKEKQLKEAVSLIIDGRTLSYALHSDFEKLFITLSMNCSSVVCCRSTPIQKAEVVKLVRDELKQLTLAIGDGANDVSMIQTADVGVGISGQEGMQAVMASDFAIARFKFLQRLLLVHGHWCYDRLARFALYMFYKNPMPNFTIFWFQIFSGFTGSITMDSFYLLLLHVLFTAVPPAINGVLDKNVSAKTLLTRHELYQTSQKGRSYTTFLFWAYVLDAIYQSLILHFVPNLAYSGSDTGLYEMGTTITVCLILTMLLFLGIETWCWTWIHWIVLVASFLMFWIFAISLSAGCLTCDPPSNPYWVLQNTVVSPTHWLLVCLTCTLALLPRFVFRSLQTNLFPTDIQKARLDEKRGLITSPVRRSTKKKSTKSVNVELPASSPSLFKKQNRSVNGHRPTTSSSVDVRVETLNARSLSPNYRGSDSLESKEL